MTNHHAGSPAPAKPAADTPQAHSARIWNYWLGGKDNYAVDRETGDHVARMLPSIVAQARADRKFLRRVVRYLTEPEGVRQFLDIGAGLPAAGNTHEVAQQAAPGAKVVYADHDPVVLSHARALLVSTREGACGYLHADLRDPEAILSGAVHTLDFAKPVALLLLGILHHLSDNAEAYAVVNGSSPH